MGILAKIYNAVSNFFDPEYISYNEATRRGEMEENPWIAKLQADPDLQELEIIYNELFNPYLGPGRNLDQYLIKAIYYDRIQYENMLEIYSSMSVEDLKKTKVVEFKILPIGFGTKNSAVKFCDLHFKGKLNRSEGESDYI